MVFFCLYVVNIYIYKVLEVNNIKKFTKRPWRYIVSICLPLLGVCMMQASGKVHIVQKLGSV